MNYFCTRISVNSAYLVNTGGGKWNLEFLFSSVFFFLQYKMLELSHEGILEEQVRALLLKLK